MEYARITPKELGIPESMPLPARKDWSIGIVGFGGIARGAHAGGWKKMGWTVAAIADPDPNARQFAREKVGVERVYDNYRDLIADSAVEVVDLCTQPVIREEVVRAAAEAGKPLITEKPFGQTVEECQRMVNIAEEAGTKLAIHQNYRWMKMNFLVHHLVRRGLIGEPFFARIEIFGRQDVGLATHPFYSKCGDFLTVQWNNHLADMLRYWTGKDARRVLARTSRMKGQNFVSDNLLVSIHDFGEGLTGHIFHHELLRSQLSGVQCRVDGNEGSAVFDFHGMLRLESTKLPGGPREVDTTGLTYLDSHCGSMADFLSAIEDDREPLVSGPRNLPTIRTVVGESKSVAAGGQWMDVG
jgi:predicted dehydrogenase